jgi:transketolase
MASLHWTSAPGPILARQAAIVPRQAPTEQRMADALRVLAADAVAAAQPGLLAMPLGMAEAASVLWARFLRFDAADPHWPDRDRFVLSAEYGAVLLYALLQLSGHLGTGPDSLERFRQLHAPTAEHPVYGGHPAAEAITGPLGQAFAAAVGIALTERLLAARFGKSLVDHRTWAVAADGDLMEGISHEAGSLAGHLRLHKLTVLYDENGNSTGGPLPLSCSDDAVKRFAAYGWAVRRIDSHDPAQVAAALSFAVRSKKPTLVACRTGSDFAAGVWADGGVLHRAAAVEAAEVRRALGWAHPPFTVTEDLARRWLAAGARGAASRRGWLKRMVRHPLRGEFERVMAGRLPETWQEILTGLKAGIAERRPVLATREASRQTVAALVSSVPELIGGSANLTDADLTSAKEMANVAPGNYRGRYVEFGAREHAMAGLLNGMVLHGGVIPLAGTYLTFSDQMRPALRLAAQMGRRVIHLLMQDGTALGLDGARQPLGHLAGLRAIPNLYVFRPADAVETVECWELALRRAGGPSVLALTARPVPALRTDAAENRAARGGYVLAEAEGPRQATLIASGPEVSIALATRALLAGTGIAAAVVSLPCWELFAQQDAAYRASVLGGVPRFGIEAAIGFGWERWLGDEGCFIGVAAAGTALAASELDQQGDISPEAVLSEVKKRLRRD